MPPKKPVPAKPDKDKPNKPKNKLLFILKAQGLYGDNTYVTKKSSGLFNSAKFVVDMLNAGGVDAVMEIAIDNNDIDRMVTAHKPTHVVIEALWVVPSKFKVLRRLHPNVQWIVRCHSEIPFLAQEGIAMDWIFEYVTMPNVKLAFNSDRTTQDFKNLLADTCFEMNGTRVDDQVLYLPNFYPLKDSWSMPFRKNKSILHVGAFGAVRPLKNQLIQAVAAIEFADKNDLMMDYHINADRVEQSGDPQLKNIRGLFRNVSSRFRLVEHTWLERPQFLDLVRSMDIGLQISFTESFNIVAADLVASGIPTVTSPEVRWMDPLFQAKTTDVADIVAKMDRAMNWKRFTGSIVDWNLRGLTKFCSDSQKIWLKYFK